MVGKPGGLEQAACNCSDEDGRSESKLSNLSPPLSDFTDDPVAVVCASISHCSVSPPLASACPSYFQRTRDPWAGWHTFTP